ncbi:hypothetical protein [Labrys sp. 22185]|uniref:hypothetical protein n=1 Tax=Labrys sp. 22185 TaxID=3453888 RepID=UPI003F86B43B
MEKDKKPDPASKIAALADLASDALIQKPSSYIVVHMNVRHSLATVVTFKDNKALASIDFDADQLDILIMQLVHARDGISGKK